MLKSTDWFRCNKIKFTVFIFLFISIFLSSNNISHATHHGGHKCTSEQLRSEQNPVEKIYCYAAKYETPLEGGWGDAYLNDPIFDELVPIAKQLINLENKESLTELERIRRRQLELKIIGALEERKSSVEQRKIDKKEQERNEIMQLLLFIIGGGLLLFVIFKIWKYYTDPENVERRKRKKRRKEKERKMKKQEEKQKKEQARKRKKQKKYEEYKKLRSEIEEMPKYQNWRNRVFEKNRRKCEVCGAKNNLEIHHRTSFYKLVKRHNIASKIEAFECDAFWDVDNGSVVCKSCHEKTESHKNYRNHKNSAENN